VEDTQNGHASLLDDESALLAALSQRDSAPVDFEWIGVATERDLVLQLFTLKADLITAYSTVDSLSDSSVRRMESIKSGHH
jgi:hypothetical protein